MMNWLRSLSRGPLLKIIFIVIIISFLLTGTAGYFVVGSKNYIAKINNTIITKSQFEEAIFQEKQMLLKEGLKYQLDKTTKTRAGVNNFKASVLDRLILIVLLNQFAKSIGLSVSNEKIRNEIYNIPFFNENGNFSSEKYNAVLKKNSIHENILLENIKNNLIINQIFKIYFLDEFILPNELKYYADFLSEIREIKLFTLNFDNYKSKQNVTNEEILKYYFFNKKLFFSDDEVKIKYIKFDSKDLFYNTNISSLEIKNFYKNNINKFIQNKQKHYSMIKVKNKKDGINILKSLFNGESFSKIAKSVSIDKNSSKNNGSIGWFERGSETHEIKIANLKNKGQISKLIFSNNNYIIYRLDDIRQKYVKKISEVKKEIFNILRHKKSRELFKSLKIKINNLIKYKKYSIFDVSKKTNINIIQTSWMNINNISKDIKFKKITNFLFDKKNILNNPSNKFNSNIIDINDECFFVIHIDKYKNKSLKSLKYVKNNIIDLIKSNKALTNLKKDVSNILFELNNKGTNNLSSKFKVIFGKSIFVNRFLGNRLFIDKVFNMPYPTKSNPIYFSIRDMKNNFVIVKLLKVFYQKYSNDDLKSFINDYKIVFSNIIFEMFVKFLHNSSKIEIEKFD